MKKTIETKEELKYIMDFYHIPYVNIEEDRRDLGRVTNKMEYKKGRMWYYTKGNECLAYNNAINDINRDIDLIKQWSDISERTFSTILIMKNKENERIENTYRWRSDIDKCHLETFKDGDGNIVFNGRICDFSNFIRYANDHMTYCNGCRYKYANEEIARLIDFKDKYGLKSKGEVDYEWWRVGIID